MRHKNSRKTKRNVPLLDLHGVTSDEVFGMLDRFLLDTSDEAVVKVMSGKGTGVVKNKVIEYLENVGYSWSYELKPNGNQNTGVILVRMS